MSVFVVLLYIEEQNRGVEPRRQLVLCIPESIVLHVSVVRCKLAYTSESHCQSSRVEKNVIHDVELSCP
jgi:hypothetical protein